MIENLVKVFLRQFSMQIKRYPDRDLKSRLTALKKFQINKILDVGANTGQFASEIRAFGFKGEIISFEPLSDAFEILQKAAKSDSNWRTFNMALGNSDGEIVINVSKNSQSSSILEMLPTHIQSAPESIYFREEKVQIKRLDSIFQDLVVSGDNVLLKIDTQGYEKNVIDGAEKSLALVKGIKLEMSLAPLYKGEMLLWEMVEFVQDKGFTLYSLENTYADPVSGKLLQVDGVFYKES